jgi:hypothetical protein
MTGNGINHCFMMTFTVSDQRNQARMQCSEDPNQRNDHNLNNVRRKASRHFRNKKKVHQKAKIDEIQMNRRPRISETCIVAVSLRIVTSLELNSKGMER